MTCSGSSHVFTNPESTNPDLLFHEIYWLFWSSQKGIFVSESKYRELLFFHEKTINNLEFADSAIVLKI